MGEQNWDIDLSKALGGTDVFEKKMNEMTNSLKDYINVSEKASAKKIKIQIDGKEYKRTVGTVEQALKMYQSEKNAIVDLQNAWNKFAEKKNRYNWSDSQSISVDNSDAKAIRNMGNAYEALGGDLSKLDPQISNFIKKMRELSEARENATGSGNYSANYSVSAYKGYFDYFKKLENENKTFFGKDVSKGFSTNKTFTDELAKIELDYNAVAASAKAAGDATQQANEQSIASAEQSASATENSVNREKVALLSVYELKKKLQREYENNYSKTFHLSDNEAEYMLDDSIDRTQERFQQYTKQLDILKEKQESTLNDAHLWHKQMTKALNGEETLSSANDYKGLYEHSVKEYMQYSEQIEEFTRLRNEAIQNYIPTSGEGANTRNVQALTEMVKLLREEILQLKEAFGTLDNTETGKTLLTNFEELLTVLNRYQSTVQTVKVEENEAFNGASLKLSDEQLEGIVGSLTSIKSALVGIDKEGQGTTLLTVLQKVNEQLEITITKLQTISSRLRDANFTKTTIDDSSIMLSKSVDNQVEQAYDRALKRGYDYYDKIMNVFSSKGISDPFVSIWGSQSNIGEYASSEAMSQMFGREALSNIHSAKEELATLQEFLCLIRDTASQMKGEPIWDEISKVTKSIPKSAYSMNYVNQLKNKKIREALPNNTSVENDNSLVSEEQSYQAINEQLTTMTNLMRDALTVKEKLATSDSGEKIVTETSALEAVKNSVEAVTTAVDNKTKAFYEEAKVVNDVVPGEIILVNNLLKSIQEVVVSLNSLPQAINNIDFSKIESPTIAANIVSNGNIPVSSNIIDKSKIVSEEVIDPSMLTEEVKLSEDLITRLGGVLDITRQIRIEKEKIKDANGNTSTQEKPFISYQLKGENGSAWVGENGKLLKEQIKTSDEYTKSLKAQKEAEEQKAIQEKRDIEQATNKEKARQTASKQAYAELNKMAEKYIFLLKQEATATGEAKEILHLMAEESKNALNIKRETLNSSTVTDINGNVYDNVNISNKEKELELDNKLADAMLKLNVASIKAGESSSQEVSVVDRVAQAYEQLAATEKQYASLQNKKYENQKLTFEQEANLNLLNIKRQEALRIIEENNVAESESTKRLQDAKIAWQEVRSAINSATESVISYKQANDSDIALSLTKSKNTLNKYQNTDNTTVYAQQKIEELNLLMQELSNLKAKKGAGIFSPEEQANLDGVLEKISLLNSQLKETDQCLKASEKDVASLSQQMSIYLNKNTNAPKEMLAQIELLRKKLKDTALSISDVKGIGTQFEKIKAQISETGKVGLAWGDRLKRKWQEVGRYLSTYMSFFMIITKIKEVANTIKELDSALVDLKKTADMSTSQLNSFYSSSSEVAKEMGVTTQQIIEQASAWSRLGYNTVNTATEMSKLSSQFASISPDMDTDKATEGLVSTMKAFEIGVEDVKDGIMSTINTVGNKFATSNGDIITGLEKSSAAMAAANNSLEETIALFTAGEEVLQNAQTMGQSLKTISMRVRGFDEETEELSDDLVNMTGEIADLTKTTKTPGGISLFTDETKETYKSTYQILKEISEIWDDLTDKNQAELLQTLFGKTRAQAGAAILQNFSQAEKAMEAMNESAGSADREMDIVKDSIEYKMNELSQTWTGFWQNTANRESIGEAIECLTLLSEAFTKLVTAIGPLGTMLGIGEFIATMSGSRGMFGKSVFGTNALKQLTIFGKTLDEQGQALTRFRTKATETFDKVKTSAQMALSPKVPNATWSYTDIRNNPDTYTSFTADKERSAIVDKIASQNQLNTLKEQEIALAKEAEIEAAKQTELLKVQEAEAARLAEEKRRFTTVSIYDENGNKLPKRQQAIAIRQKEAEWVALQAENERILAEVEAQEAAVAAEVVATEEAKNAQRQEALVVSNNTRGAILEENAAIAQRNALINSIDETSVLYAGDTTAGADAWVALTESENAVISENTVITEENVAAREAQNAADIQYAEAIEALVGAETQETAVSSEKGIIIEGNIAKYAREAAATVALTETEQNDVLKKLELLAVDGKLNYEELERISLLSVENGEIDAQTLKVAQLVLEKKALADATLKASRATTILSSALNMAVMMLAMKAITAAIGKLKEWVNTAEEAKESAEAFGSSMKSAFSDVAENTASLGELNAKYQEFSKGVDSLGNNISLSNDEYEEYKNTIAEISKIIPNLTTYFNDQGEAIGFTAGKIEDLSSKYKEYIKEKAASYLNEGDEDGNTFQDALDNYSNNDEETPNLWYRLQTLAGRKDEKITNTRALLTALKEIQKLHSSEEVKAFLERKAPAGSSYSEKMVNPVIKKMLGDGSNEDFNVYIDKVNAAIQKYSEDFNKDLNNVIVGLQASVYANDSFWEIESEEARNNIMNFFSGLKPELWDSLDIDKEDNNAVRAWVNSVVEAFADPENGEKLQQAWSKLFSLDKDKIDPVTYNNSVSKYVDFISTQLKLDKEAFTKSFNIDYIHNWEKTAVSFSSLATSIGSSSEKIKEALGEANTALESNPLQSKPLQSNPLQSNLLAVASDPGISVSKGKVGLNSFAISNYITRVKELGDAYDKFQSGDYNNVTVFTDELIKKFPELSKYSGDLDVKIIKLINDLNGDMVGRFSDKFGQLREKGAVDDIQLLQEYEDAVLSVGRTITDTDLNVKIPTETEGLDNFYQSITDSVSGTGLTEDDVTNLTKRYSKIKKNNAHLSKSFDNLFEYTENGIRVNINALNDLENAYEKSINKDFTKELDSLASQYNDLTTQINDAATAEERMRYSKQRDKIYEKIKSTKQLQAQYEGLISSFNKWQKAISTKDDDNMYNVITDAKDDMKELYKLGKMHSDDMLEYLQMFTNTNVYNMTNDELDALWKKAEKTQKNYFTGTSKGLVNFCNDLKKVNDSLGKDWITLDNDGSYFLDFKNTTEKEVAEAMRKAGYSVSEELIEILVRAMQPYSDFNVKIEADYSDVKLAETEVEKTIKKLKDKELTTFDFEFNTTDIEVINKDIDALKDTLEAMEKQGYKPDSSLYQEVEKLLEKANQYKEALENDVLLTLDTSQFTEDGKAAIELLINIRDTYAGIQTKKELGLDTTKAKEQLDTFMAELEKYPDVKEVLGLTGIDCSVTVDDSSIQSAVEKIKTIDTNTAQSFSNISSTATETGSTVEGEVDDVNDKVVGLSDSLNGINNVDLSTAKSNIYNNLTSSLQGTNTELDRVLHRFDEIKNKSALLPPFKADANGTVNANANGTMNAHAKGSVAIKGDETALVNELGNESIVRDGVWMEIPGGAHTEKLQKGDIIFNHKQTEELKKNGKVTSGGGRGRLVAHSDGTFSGMPAHATTGGINKNRSSTSSKKSSKKSKKSSGKGSSKSSDKSLETFDWIEVKIQRIEEVIDRLNAKATATWRGWATRNKQLVKEISKVKEEIKIQDKAYSKYMSKANKVKLSKKYKKLVREGKFDIQKINTSSKKGKALAEAIKEYQEYYDKAQNAKKATEELKQSLADLYKQKFDNITSQYSNSISNNEHKRNMLNQQSSSYYTDLSKEYKDEKSKLQDELAKLKKTQADAVKKGSIKKYSEAWYDMQKQINETEEKIKEANDNIVQATMDAFERIVTKADQSLSKINHDIAMLDKSVSIIEAKGGLVSAKYYENLQKEQEKIKKGYEKELKDLIVARDKALANGTIKKGSDEWYEMQEQIQSTEEAIRDAELAMIEYGNSARQAAWAYNDALSSSLSNYTSENDFLIGELSRKDLTNKDGSYTDEGLAVQGLHAMNYNTYAALAAKYGDEAASLKSKVEAMYAGKIAYDSELIDRYNELVSAQRDAISSSYEELEAMKELVSNGYDNMLEKLQELIDKRKEALQAEKDLYDYKNSIEEKTSSIKSIQKQLISIQGDDSEEARDRIRQLTSDLASAEKDLQDAQYDKWMQDQENLLDEIYKEAETFLDEKMSEMEVLLSEQFDLVNENAKVIYDTVENMCDSLGYDASTTLSSALDKALGGKSLVTYFEEGIGALTSDNGALGANGHINTWLSSINALLINIQASIDKANTSSSNSNSGSSSSSDSQASMTAITGDFLEPVPILDGLRPLEDVKKKTTKKYAIGSRYISYDQLALTQEKGQEVIYRAKDGAMLTPLGKGDKVFTAEMSNRLWNLAKGMDIPLSTIAASIPEISSRNNTNVSNDFSITFSLPGVTNYNEFVTKLKSDSQFEKFVQEVTIGQAMGNNSLNKLKY